MSEEFPVNIRRIGKNEMEPLGLSFDGHVGYRFNVKMRPNEISKTYKALKQYFKTLNYKLPMNTEAPIIMIPSIGKMFVTIIGEEGVSVYPQDSNHQVKDDNERSEFKKFLKDFESFFESI